MEGSRMMVAAFFAIIIVSFYWLTCVYILNPFLQKKFITTDDTIAVYIDTLSAVESGRVMIPLEKGLISYVKIIYETEGEKAGYEIKQAGWYVVVKYVVAKKDIMDATLIETYPYDESLAVNIISPEQVCITKEPDKRYAEVSKC